MSNSPSTKNFKLTAKVICNVVSLLLMISLLVMHFLPFWNFSVELPANKETSTPARVEERSASIASYTWFPSNHKACATALELSDPANNKTGKSGLENYLNDSTGTTVFVNDIVIMPVIFIITTIICLLLVLIKTKEMWAPIFAVIGGAFALVTYLISPVFALGTNVIVHIALAAAVAVVGLATIVLHICSKKK